MSASVTRAAPRAKLAERAPLQAPQRNFLGRCIDYFLGTSTAVAKIEKVTEVLNSSINSELYTKSGIPHVICTLIKQYAGDPIYSRMNEIGATISSNEAHRKEFIELLKADDTFDLRKLRYLDATMLAIIQETRPQLLAHPVARLIVFFFRDYYVGSKPSQAMQESCFSQFFVVFRAQTDPRDRPLPPQADFRELLMHCWREKLFTVSPEIKREMAAAADDESQEALHLRFLEHYDVRHVSHEAVRATLKQLQL